MGDPPAPPSRDAAPDSAEGAPSFSERRPAVAGSGSSLRSSRGWRLLASLPLTVALAVAGFTLNAPLAPAHDVGEDLRLQNEPPPPAESSPVHHDESVFDPMELISV